MNVCTTCGQDFGSVEAFDKHRVGRNLQYGPAEFEARVRRGLETDPWTPEKGRRCLELDELEASPRFTRNRRGRWILDMEARGSGG